VERRRGQSVVPVLADVLEVFVERALLVSGSGWGV